MLCSKCTSVHFTPPENCPPSLKGLFDTSSPELDEDDQVYLHSANSKCLKSSADAGCQLCAMIWYHFDYQQYTSSLLRWNDEQVIFACIQPLPSQQTPTINVYHKTMVLSLHCVHQYPGKQCPSLFMSSIMIGNRAHRVDAGLTGVTRYHWHQCANLI
jgi:hypothetical protein